MKVRNENGVIEISRKNEFLDLILGKNEHNGLNDHIMINEV